MSLDKRISGQALGQSAIPLLDIYLFLQVAPGHVLLPALAATFLFSRAKRHPTLINLIFVIIYTDIVSCFLLYNGTQIGPQPSQSLCIAQTALINGGPPAWAVAILMLVFNMWYSFRYPKHPMRNPWLKHGILAAPWISALVWIIPAAILSWSMPDRVNRDRRFFYCSINFSPYSTPAELFEATVNLLTLFFEVHLALHLWRSTKAMRLAGRSASAGLDSGFIIRVLVFGVYILVGAAISFAMVWSPVSAFPDMYAASVGMAVFLVFGTQRDVARVWCFWFRPVPSEPQQPYTVQTGARPSSPSFISFPRGSASTDMAPAKRVTIIEQPGEAFEKSPAIV